MRKTIHSTIWLIVALFLISACGTVSTTNQQSGSDRNATTTSGTTNKVEVSLIRIVDGDTIKVNYNGQEETVRYLLVDTPETKAPNKCVQPFGKDASKRNEELVTNAEKLELEFDVGSRTDKYGRLLAYVYADGVSVQQTLLIEGLARVAYVYPPNTRYLDTFEEAEAAAKNDDEAVWQQSGYVTDRGFNGCATSQDSSDKPVDSSSNESTQFANCTELRKIYPDGVPSTHAAYQRKFDRDKDDYACE
ncbi:endonuclease [Terribacillus saccharophilus]|uniref:thermonuclease family protein n=1 Tax=Terribacillus saccharophilus TaxID=361277 RepID=UPI000BA7E20A|nr:thermonuclease family protein [Terribacillus saccharophilus]PAF35134.1 endonuclease [Terribacillus saccharophilus]PAF37872.1 endonuclease [Terribacillus saccharophilus]